MKRALQVIVALLLALLALILAVSSCAPQTSAAQTTEAPEPLETPEPVETPAQAPESGEPSPVESPEPTPDAVQSTPSMEELSPAERAAVWGLPEPPEGIDLSGREFMVANSYNSITETRPNHAYGAGVTVDAVASDAFNRFVADMQAAGYPVAAYRGYLDYWTVLENYYEPELYAHGAAYAASVTHVPGCNDHQTGTCIDLRLNDGGGADSGLDFRGTEAWDWAMKHCVEYGIILRYPEGQEGWYGYPCMNPCHFRYVGEAAAKYIMDNNITLEQFVLLYDWNAIYVPGVNGWVS